MQNLTPQQIKKLKKVAEVIDKGNIAVLEHLFELEETLEEKIKEVEKKLSEKSPDLNNFLKSVRGTQGETGEKGDRGDKGERGERGRDGKDGRNGTDGKNGINGVNGINGIDGRDGKDGVDGNVKDVSPQEIRDLLELLEEEERLDKTAIKGLEDIYTQVDEISKRPTINGGKGKVVEIQAGANITVDNSDPNRPVVSSTGGTGSSTMYYDLSDSTDGVTKSFTIPANTRIIWVCGTDAPGGQYRQTVDYTGTGTTTLTLTSEVAAPSAGATLHILYVE